MDYRSKEIKMQDALQDYVAPTGFRSSYKNVPYSMYGLLKPYIDFTKYYVMFRGPRKRWEYSTRKRNAKAFDVYMRSARDTLIIRTERESFLRGVNWANNRSH